MLKIVNGFEGPVGFASCSLVYAMGSLAGLDN
jgi:hypothetical protein